MDKDYRSVWDSCLRTIKRNVNTQTYKTWFVPIKPIKLIDYELTIQVPNDFFYDWLEEHYVTLLKTSIRKELGEQATLEYQILTGPEFMRARAGQPINSGALKPSSRKEIRPSSEVDAKTGIPKDEAIKNPFLIPGIKRIKIDPQLNPNLTFSNFIEGDCNKLARSAANAIADKPGKTAFNPLVIYGNSGLGKTHLAQAVGNAIVNGTEEKTVLYVSSEVFTNQVVKSIKENATEDFVNFYQLVDVLIVDDIQFLEGKQKTQEIFFHIFNQLHQNGKQIIMTSDRPPKDLDGLQDRLISRFKWGLTADLQEPDYETRMAIFEHKMHEDNIEIPQEIKEFVCFNIHGNIRELEGILVSLEAQRSLTQRTVDMDLAKSVIKQYIKQSSNEINVDYIIHLVADAFNVTLDQLQSSSRKREIVIARQMAMHLGKEYTDVSLKELGASFGGRDHSTVLYSIKTAKDLLDTDEKLHSTVSGIIREIKMNLK